jgi:hypothetical protein
MFLSDSAPVVWLIPQQQLLCQAVHVHLGYGVSCRNTWVYLAWCLLYLSFNERCCGLRSPTFEERAAPN